MIAYTRRLPAREGRATPTNAKLIGVGIVALLIGMSQAVTVVPAGHVVDVFGNVSPTTLKLGINIVNPFADVIHVSIKT